MSKRMSRFPTDCKVYVGDLGNNARKQDLEDAFGYYGQLRNVWVARNPPGFAFVEFEDARDAEDSVRGLDGRSICNRKIRVELSTCKNGRGGYRSNMSRRNNGRPFNPDDRCYDCGDRGHYARDCRKKGGRGRGRRSRSRSRSRSRDRRTRSRSGTRSRSRSVRRSASPASVRNGHSRSKSFNRSPRIERTKSPLSRSRSRSYDNGKF